MKDKMTLREVLIEVCAKSVMHKELSGDIVDKALSEIKKLGVVGYHCYGGNDGYWEGKCKEGKKCIAFAGDKCKPVLIIDMSKIEEEK